MSSLREKWNLQPTLSSLFFFTHLVSPLFLIFNEPWVWFLSHFHLNKLSLLPWPVQYDKMYTSCTLKSFFCSLTCTWKYPTVITTGMQMKERRSKPQQEMRWAQLLQCRRCRLPRWQKTRLSRLLDSTSFNVFKVLVRDHKPPTCNKLFYF